MLFSKSEKTYPLTYEGIDAISEQLDEWLVELRVERRNHVLLRLTIEEALLRICRHFGQKADQSIHVEMGTNLVDSYVRITHRGRAFNPLGEVDAVANQWSSSLVTSIGLRPHYSYMSNTNVLRVSFMRKKMNPALALIIGLSLGTLVGVVGNLLMPQSVQDVVIHAVVGSTFEIWTRILNAMAGPVIFFMVITTLLNAQKVEELGGNKMVVIARYFAVCLVVGFVAVGTATEVFQPARSEGNFWTIFKASEMLQGLVNIVPKHILDPFSTSNTPQLMLLAFVLGNALIALGERAGVIDDFVGQANMACSLVTSWISMLVPLLSAILLTLEIWDNQVTVLAQLWKPILLGLILSLLFIGIGIGYVCLRYKIGARHLMQKLRAPFEIALRTGSLEESYGEAEHSCVKLLGIDSTFTSVTLPQGLVIYMPASVIGTLVFTVFDAEGFNVAITLQWCAAAVVLDVLLFVATPPVPGANLLAFITLFNYLGIPSEALLDAMIFDILFGLFANAANQALLQIELVQQSDGMGLLDRETLRS